MLMNRKMYWLCFITYNFETGRKRLKFISFFLGFIISHFMSSKVEFELQLAVVTNFTVYYDA